MHRSVAWLMKQCFSTAVSRSRFLLWLHFIWRHAKGHFREEMYNWGAASLSKHNTSISSSNFYICQSTQPICLHTRKGKDRHSSQKKKRWNSISNSGLWPRRKRVWVFALCRHSWGWSETRLLLMKRLLHAAHDSLARTLVSLRFHSRTARCSLCVCVIV